MIFFKRLTFIFCVFLIFLNSTLLACKNLIELESVINCRDLGGFVTADNLATNFNVFFRSGNTNMATENDIKKLIDEHGLTTVIDLRTEVEILEFPDKFSNISGIKYLNYPIDYNDCLKDFKEDDRCGLHVLHRYILENKKSVLKDLFNAIADSKEGGILFHCTLGRDRTGVLAMLLFDLVGVSESDIVSDYVATYDFIKHLDKVKEDLKFYGKNKTQTLPEHVKMDMEFIKENNGTSSNYLINCGVSEENLEKIKNKFIAKN